MSHTRKHAKQAIKQRGEVFTPTPLVNEMLDKLPKELFLDPDKTFLDNSCGNGNFLVAVLERKMQNGISHKQALNTIYGVEIDENNSKECRQRLSLGSQTPEIWTILENNIITADGLDPNHPGWIKVGFYWDREGLPKIIIDIMTHWNEQIKNGETW
jgi:hypothetical protein